MTKAVKTCINEMTYYLPITWNQFWTETKSRYQDQEHHLQQDQLRANIPEANLVNRRTRINHTPVNPKPSKWNRRTGNLDLKRETSVDFKLRL